MNSVTPVNVLLIEDNLDDSDLVKAFLSGQKTHNYRLECLSTYDEALTTISSGQIVNYDVVLVDYFLDKKNGLDLVKEISNRKLGMPIIFLTANNNVELDLEAMKLGASDFIIKGKFDAELIDRSIRYSIEMKKNQRLLIKQQQKEAALMKASALADMAKFVTHEINNPLSVIQMQATAMEISLNKNINDIEKTKSQLKKILVMIDRIFEIKKNLNKFYQTQDLDLPEDLEHEDVTEIIRDSLLLCRDQLSMCGVAATFDAAQPVMIACQSIEISQVFVNLITNSCEAIKDLSEKWIKIELKEEAGKAKITFTDSGHGISEEVTKKLFSKYFTTKKAGSGIGLHLSRHIIESYYGSLQLMPNSPHTQFLIELPTNSNLVSKKTYRILVVDDEIDFANIISDHLFLKGYEAEIESNPNVARERLLKEEFDGVISDINMMGQSGLDMALELKALRAKIPVFTFMSGHITSAIRSILQEENLGPIFEKPFNVEELVEATIRSIKDHNKA